MESSYNESMLDFDLSYFEYKNESQKKPHTKEDFLRIKKKIINTDAILQSHKKLKNDLIQSRNECKQIRIDQKETTRKLKAIENENEKLKKHTNETVQKQNYDNLQLQGLQSYIKQLKELVAEKESKIGSIELEKQLLLSTVQDQKKQYKKSLRSNVKEKNRQSSDTIASFTGSDFEIDHAYSIDTGCGSSITSPDYSSNNSPISLDCLQFQKSTTVVSVATSPIEFLSSIPETELKPQIMCVDEVGVETDDANDDALNVTTEREQPKICVDEYTSTQSSERSNKTIETDANDSVDSTQYLDITTRSNVAVQTEPEPQKNVSDKYTSTKTLISIRTIAVETDDNDLTSRYKNTSVEDIEVQSILDMMTISFPAISPIPPSPVMLKDASTQSCFDDHYDINCPKKILPHKNISNDISNNRKKSVDSNYVPLLENNLVNHDAEINLSVTPDNCITNRSNIKHIILPLSKNTLVDFNDCLNDCSRKSPSNKHISKGKQINDLKDSKIQKVLHDLGLSESDSDIDEVVNTNSSSKTYPKHKDLKTITLSTVNSYLKSYNVNDANKNVLRNKTEVHISRNSIENCRTENTVQSTKSINEPLLKSASVKIRKLSSNEIEKYTLVEPFKSDKVTRKIVSEDFRKNNIKDFDNNLISKPEKAVKSPKLCKELHSPVLNNVDCVQNSRLLQKSISSVSDKDTKLRKLYEDLEFSESDSELLNTVAGTIHEELEDLSTDIKKYQNFTNRTDVSENHVRILRSKSSRQSTLLAKASNSENQRPDRMLKRKCSTEFEFANKRVLRNNRTSKDNRLNTEEDYLKESNEQVENLSIVQTRTRQSNTLSNKKPTCKRILRRHKNSENNNMVNKEIADHSAPISLEKIKPKKLSLPKSPFSRSSESESELSHGRVLRSMSSPKRPYGSLDKKLIMSPNPHTQTDNITYLTRYRLKRLSVEDDEMKSLKEITNVSPVILHENKGELQSPLKNKTIPNDTFVPTRTKPLSTHYGLTKKPAVLPNPHPSLHRKDTTTISEGIQEDNGELQGPLKNKIAASDTFVPTRTKRLSTYYNPVKNPEILSNQQSIHTKDATITGESIGREPDIDDTSIPTRKKRISTYVRPLKNNDISNETEVNNVNKRKASKPTNNTSQIDLRTNQTLENNVNLDKTSKPMRNKLISSYVKDNNSNEIYVNYSNSTEQETLNNAPKKSPAQLRPNMVAEICRKSLENSNDSKIDDIPPSKVVSYSDLDMFTDNDTTPGPKNAPSTSRCNTTNSFFWKMLEQYCGRNTHRRKSHLLTDSAVNTICEILEVNIARITDLPDGFVQSEMKELANTICKEERKILISAVLSYLMSPKRQSDTECRKYTPPAPIMSKQEQVLLFVLDYIREECQYNIFYDILKSIEYALFRLNHTPEFVHVENLSHFYAVICRFVGSVAQLRTFLIDAMYCMSYKAVIVANQCLNVWMHTLPLAHLRTAKNPLVVGIVYLLYYFKCEKSANIVSNLKNTLQKRYCYKMTEWNETKLLQFIRTSIVSIKENALEMKNMRCCLILLAKREGVKWCQKNIIEKMLMPIINNPSTPERVKRFSISLLGPIMRPYPNKMKIHCEIVIDYLISLVNSQCCSQNMEETIFRSLIYLNKHNSHKVARALLSWTPQEKVSDDFYWHVVDYISEKSSRAWLKILKK